MSNNKRTVSWDKIVSIVALLLSSLALFFAWQTNQIANRQLASQVAILSTEFVDGNWNQETDPGKWRFAYCEHKVRLFNFEGAPDSIIRYEASIGYKDQELSLQSSESWALWSPGIQPFMVSVSTELLSEDLPLAIDAFSAKDIITKLSFAYDDDLLDINVSYPYNPTYEYQKDIGPEFYPLAVQYKFYTAAGRTLDTGKTICHYFK